MISRSAFHTTELKRFLFIGLLWAPDPHWRWLREFTATALNDYNLSNFSAELKIHEEVQHFIHFYVQPKINLPVNIATCLPHATFNVKTQLLFNTRLNYNDQDFFKIFEAVKVDRSLISRRLDILSNTPLISYLLSPYLKTLKKRKSRYMAAFIRKQMAEHKKSRNLEKPRDVLDLYLKTQSKLLKERDKAPRQCFTGKCGTIGFIYYRQLEHWLMPTTVLSAVTLVLKV